MEANDGTSFVSNDRWNECSYQTKSITLRGLKNFSNFPQNSPIHIFLHGFMDNCGIFKEIASQTKAPSLLIDLPGHGLSDFKPMESLHYSILDYIYFLKELFKQLPLPIVLIGHSLGAGIASLSSALFPELIEKLILLDAIAPSSQQGRNTFVDDLKLFFKDLEETKPPSYYTDYSKALKARVHSDVDQRLAEVLANRGVLKDQKGYYWRYDPRLKLKTPTPFHSQQITELLSSIKAPTLVLEAKKTTTKNKKIHLLIPKHQYKTVESGHYSVFKNAPQTSKLISDFTLRTEKAYS